MRFGMPRTYAEYTPPRGWAGVRARFRRLFAGLTVDRRLRQARQPPRTDDPVVGQRVRWLGNAGLPASVVRIRVGTVGTVTGWQPANGGKRQYLVDFDSEDGGGVTLYTSLPAGEIELA